MVSAVAVAVDAVPYLMLDEDYRIVEVHSAAPTRFGSLLGRDLWECFPDSEPLFRPYYEEAWRTGEPVEFVQFYDGRVGRIRATPEGSRLALSWEHVVQLETLTLEGLRSSLTETIAALEGAAPGVAREGSRGRLRLVVGDTSGERGTRED